MSLRIPSPKALTKPEAYLAYKAGIMSRDELKQSVYNPLNNYEGWLAKWCGLLETYPTNEDGTPQCLTDEEGLLAYLCGVTNRYPATNSRPDDARISAYIRYLVSARYTRPDHPLNREEFYLSLIKTQFIPSGDPSSDIEIDGTTKAPFVDVKLYGDTAQNSYTGKNLLPPNRNQIVAGISIVWNSDGTVDITGTATGEWPALTVLPYALGATIPSGTQLTLSMTAPLPTGTRLWLREYNVGETAYKNHSIPDNGTSVTFSISADMDRVGLVLGTTPGTTLDVRGLGIMLEVGSTATSYEPYVGGVPSPNPEYPQPIKTVTGLQTVEIQGKNLNRFPYASGASITHRGVTFTANSDGSVTIKGTHDGSGTAIYYFRNFWTYNETDGVVVDANTTVTASISGGTEYGIRFIAEGYHSDGTYDQFNTTSSQTITTAAKATFNGRITVYAGFSSEEGVTVYPMLEKGSTASDYIPYSKHTYSVDLGDIELCGLGDDGDGNPLYEDYIYSDEDEWKLHKATKSINFTDGGGFFRSGRTSNTKFVAACTLTEADDVSLAEKRNIMSQFFTFVNGTPGINQIDVYNGTTYATSLAMSFDIAKIADITAAQAWITQNEPTVYFVRLTPTDIVITDQNLIDQLNALKQGGAEEGTTYIKVSATDPNLPAKLYVEAPKYD